MSDLVGAYLGRIYPDADNALDKADIVKILRGLKNNAPDVLLEMKISRAGEKLARSRVPIVEAGGFLRLDGPLVSRHLDIFACKLGLAMHYEATRSAVPLNGGVSMRVFSNVQRLEGKFPEHLLQHLPPSQTLRQGKWDVADQFEYAIRITEDRQMVFSFASFRFSFAVFIVTATDRSMFNPQISPIFPPGELWKDTRA